MNRRIYSYMIILAIISLFVSDVLLLGMFGTQIDKQMREAIRGLRVSIVEENGNVIYDNKADSAEMENHGTRPEIVQAIEQGFGESHRYSETENEITYYYAIRTYENRILRLAITADSLTAIVLTDIPIMLTCLAGAVLLAFLLAKSLTTKIVSPINDIDLDNPSINIYDELMPFINRIKTQREEISSQMISLEKRTDTIKTITDNMHEGIILVDGEGNILMSNESIEKILGVEIMDGLLVMEVYREAEFVECVKKCLKGHETEMDLVNEGRIYDVLFSPVKTGGGVILFIDVTEKTKAREQREEFSANVSHELKTPLTSISALSEMIADGTAKEEDIRAFAAKINKHAKRLVSTIDDVIKLSEFDENNVDEKFTDIDLCEIAREVVEDLADKAKDAKVELKLECGQSMPVKANRRMMDELLFNLTDNGIKYNKQGGSVEIALKENDGHFIICVSDTGIGIPAEHLDRIFERFYRVDKSRSKKTGGTGLGLSIVKHIVEFHGGKVDIESKQNEGTVITCYIKKSLF